MIADLLIAIILSIFDLILGVLPTASLGLSDATSSVADFMGQKSGPMDSMLPVHELFQVVAVGVVVYMPAMAVYVTANWIFRHFPWVGAGG